MNTDWFDLTPGAGDPVGTPTLSDLVVRWFDRDVDSAVVVETLDAGDGLALEKTAGASATLLGTKYRIRGIPFRANRHKVYVAWAVSGDAIYSGEIGGTPDEVHALYGLFVPAPGLTPVNFDLSDQTTGDPVGDVEITIWDSTLMTPVVPLVRTTLAGRVTVGLPPGSYRVFAHKPYSSFTDDFPLTLTVGTDPVTLSMTLSQSRPALPVVPKVTVFGWVLRPDYTPVVGAEVKLRLLNTPQLAAGGGGLTRFEITVLTDAEGRFEMYPVGGITAYLTCESVGYSRKGRLPNGGSLNWKDLAIEAIP